MTAEISRRVTLAWVVAAALSPFAAPDEAAMAAPRHLRSNASPWKAVELSPITAPGYGTDPNLMKPVVPWPLTLHEEQRALLRAAGDIVLPADAHSPSASALHIDAFIDEWISAPYPQQQQDRALLLSGLQWIDAETTRRFGASFLRASDNNRRAVLDTIAFRDTVKPGYEQPAHFFSRLRGLMLAGFYASPQGIADLGYRGNEPHLGDYPGPSEEALAQLNMSLTKLGLKPVKS